MLVADSGFFASVLLSAGSVLLSPTSAVLLSVGVTSELFGASVAGDGWEFSPVAGAVAGGAAGLGKVNGLAPKAGAGASPVLAGAGKEKANFGVAFMLNPTTGALSPSTLEPSADSAGLNEKGAEPAGAAEEGGKKGDLGG